MHSLAFLNLPSLVSFAQWNHLIPITGIVVPFAFVLVIVLTKTISEAKERKLQHETIRLALEKGQAIPEGLFKPLPKEEPKNDDRKSGLILVALATGLYLMFQGMEHLLGSLALALRYTAAIPGLIGLALLVNSLFSKKETGRSSQA